MCLIFLPALGRPCQLHTLQPGTSLHPPEAAHLHARGGLRKQAGVIGTGESSLCFLPVLVANPVVGCCMPPLEQGEELCKRDSFRKLRMHRISSRIEGCGCSQECLTLQASWLHLKGLLNQRPRRWTTIQASLLEAWRHAQVEVLPKRPGRDAVPNLREGLQAHIMLNGLGFRA